MRKYNNLAAEIVRANLTFKELGEMVDMKPQTITRKIHGTTEITVPEAIRIWKALGKPLPFDVLFATE